MNRVVLFWAGLLICLASGAFLFHSVAADAETNAPAGSTLQQLKAQEIYDAEQWRQFLGREEDSGREHRSLDQGGDDFATATLIPNLPYNDFGQTIGFQNNYYEICEGGPGPDQAPDVVYQYVAVQTQVVDISLCGGSNFDTQLYVYENIHTPGNPYACNDDFCPPLRSELHALSFNAGNTYYIVVDGWGPEQGFYTITVIGHAVEPCACPNPEQEPNDNLPIGQSIGLGEDFCGVISTPNDVDLVRLNQTTPSAIRLTLLGNQGPQPCPGGQGLHPAAQILSEDGEVLAYAGDTTNQSLSFESNFAFGGYSHILRITGANGTIGPYVVHVDPIDLPVVAPPTPQPTLYQSAGVLRMYWNASYLPGESLVIETAEIPDGPWTTYAVIFNGPSSFPIPATNERRFFRMRTAGERPVSPFVGSVLPLAEPGANPGEDTEVAQFQVQEIEWARDGSGNIGIARLLAQGVGPNIGEFVDQDNRQLYQNGYTPITDFAGTRLNVFGREVIVEHCEFVRDPVTGTIGIVDGRGRTPAGDSLMYFSDSPQYLIPQTGITGNWVGWNWWDWCPGFCCRLKVVAFCRATMMGWNPACTGTSCPGNPACYLGCPCPPVGFLCVPPPPGCAPCALVPDAQNGVRHWCTCESIDPPGPSMFCFFQILVKCKSYDCQDGFLDCSCAMDPCPGPAVWTPVAFVNSAMRAACAADCDIN